MIATALPVDDNGNPAPPTNMDYLIRFVQMHETFRKPETDAIADLLGLELEWLSYTEDVRPLK